VLPGVLVERAPYLGRLGLLLQFFDRLCLADGFTMDCVLKPFDHRFEVLDASLDQLETLRYGRLELA
jgi:hypothetical protein